MQLQNELSIVEAIGSSQISRPLFSGFKGQHMVELVICGSPKWSPEWKFQFLASAFPVVEQKGCKFLEVGHVDHRFIVFIDKIHHPPLAARQDTVPSCPPLQLHYHAHQELLIHVLTIGWKTIPKSRQKEPIHLCQLVRLRMR